jgi:hypothetical protein
MDRISVATVLDESYQVSICLFAFSFDGICVFYLKDTRDFERTCF